jgi:hypothetical protein
VRELEAGRYLPRQRLVVEPAYQNGNQEHDRRDGSEPEQQQPADEQQDEALLHQLLNQDGNNES